MVDSWRISRACGRVWLLVALISAAVVVSVSVPDGGVSAAYGCYGYTRDCTNPTDSRWNCGNTAFTARTNRRVLVDSVVAVDLRYSSSCSTGWARTNEAACANYGWSYCDHWDVWAERSSPGASTQGLVTYSGGAGAYSKQLQDSASLNIRARYSFFRGDGTTYNYAITAWY